MKCVECVGYAECSKKHNLTIKRKHCPMAKVEYVQTNADRIRAMSDEELAWELMTWRIETEAKHHGVESNYPNTKTAILEWLKQPAEVDNG